VHATTKTLDDETDPGARLARLSRRGFVRRAPARRPRCTPSSSAPRRSGRHARHALHAEATDLPVEPGSGVLDGPAHRTRSPTCASRRRPGSAAGRFSAPSGELQRHDPRRHDGRGRRLSLARGPACSSSAARPWPVRTVSRGRAQEATPQQRRSRPSPRHAATSTTSRRWCHQSLRDGLRVGQRTLRDRQLGPWPRGSEERKPRRQPGRAGRARTRNAAWPTLGRRARAPGKAESSASSGFPPTTSRGVGHDRRGHRHPRPTRRSPR